MVSEPRTSDVPANAVHPSAVVHSTAILDANVAVGAGTRIWHFYHLSEGAVIGERCILGQNVFVGRDVHIGSGVKIQNNVSVVSGVTIEDDVFVGPSVVFTNVLRPRAFTEKKGEFRPTRIEKGATLGANATVLCGNSVGAYAMVGAGGVITNDVPPHALMIGNPARQVGWVNKEGEPATDPPAPFPTKA